MVLPELISWLESDGYGTGGVNLFYGIEPHEPNSMTCLHEYSSLPIEVVLGSNQVNQEIVMVQAVVRGEPNIYDAPRLKINQLVASFTKIGEVDILGVRYHAMIAQQSPFMVSPDDNFRNTFKVNFRVWKDPSTT
jgi:hypothetical protein